MVYKEKVIKKLYYSIGEVAKKFNVTTSLIRFWETEFDILKPKKNRKGNRQYTDEDIEQISIIYNLVKEKGYKLAGAKEILKKDVSGIKHKLELVESLRNIRKFLVEVKNSFP